MTTPSYSLGAQPEWYLVDNVGRPTAGFLYTYSNLNQTQFKPTYADIGGNTPNTNPIRFNENGTAPPIYFKSDPSTPDDNAYYLVFNDENNNFLYAVPNYLPTGSGGGGSVTTATNLKNYTGNNVYLYNIVATSVSPIPTNTVLCPNNNLAFIDPDTRFIRESATGADVITFKTFTFGETPLTADVTPQYFLNYHCSSAGTGQRYIQIPIQPKVTTLANQQITVRLWARCNSGNTNITVQAKQFFGSGVGASGNVLTTIGSPISLTSSWVQYAITGTIPSVSTLTVADTGDDAVYLIVQLPDATTDIDITKVSMYLGSAAPVSDFNSQQQLEVLIDCPRTGDTKSGMIYSTYIPGGWIPLNDGTVGPPTASGASPPIIRNNQDTWFLFNYIWNNTTNTECPIYLSDGTVSSRGGTAVLDWEANKRIALPSGTGRVISNTSGSHLIGASTGADTVTLDVSTLPTHNHTASSSVSYSGSHTHLANLYTTSDLGSPGKSFSTLGPGPIMQDGGISVSTTTSNKGDGGAHNNIQPTVYIPTIMKL